MVDFARWTTWARLSTLALAASHACQEVHALPHDARHDHSLAARQTGGNYTSSSGPVSWDGTSFTVLGEQILINSVEFHPWRLPVPALWRDPLQKLKAAGINTLSIYTHWALVMPSPESSSVTLEAPQNRLADFLTVAKEVGLFVILRPGPYINAETTGGGMPGWVQNLDTQLRTNTTVFNDAWKPYMKAIVDAAAPFQVKQGSEAGSLDTSAGTVLALQVENEFQDTQPMSDYFDEIINFYRDNGITVPTTFNALSGSTAYANNTLLDIWGQDSYPQNFDCANPTVWAPVNNYTDLATIRPSNPRTIPEFQGGSYDAWGGSTYDSCAQLTNSSFVSVFDKGVLGDGIKYKSDYMGYGGTNWGNLAFGGLVYTSYDYGAGLDERRIIRDKLRESALIGSFIASFPAFASAEVQQQGVNLGVSEQSEPIVVSRLAANDAGTNSPSFYYVRHNDSSSSSIATFRLQLQDGTTIPQSGKSSIVGRDAMILPVNAEMNVTGATMQYSTSDVAFLGSIGERDVAVLYGVAGQSYEVSLSGFASANTSDTSGVEISQNGNATIIAWTAQSNYALTVEAQTSDGKKALFRLASRDYAHDMAFTSTTSMSTLDGILGRGDRVVVHGAYHVSNATISEDGSTLALYGQLNGTSTSDLDVIAPESVQRITFNSQDPTSNMTIHCSSLQATFACASEEAKSFAAVTLSNWKYNDSLPEIQPGYTPDSNWRSANLTSTPNAWFANATTPQVLFADAYGFHSGGAIIWQGRFDANQTSGMPDSLSVKYIGGLFSASSTYLNGKYVGVTNVTNETETTTGSFDLTSDMFVSGENVFTVLMDSTGLEETGSITEVDGYQYPRENTKQPRGILTFDLLSSGQATNTTLDWIVTGNEGGETLLDTTRGPLNEGGLYGERRGWHLPGFDDSTWQSTDPTTQDGGVSGSGVRFYRTNVTLDVPEGYDIPLSFVYGGDSRDQSQSWRSLLFVNGWQYGKRWVQFGPQTRFPVPPGILDIRGDNTIAVALWSPSDAGAVLPQITIEKDGVFTGEVEFSVNNPTWQEVRGAK